MQRALASLRTGRGLRSFAALALAWMVLVILEGAIVRATGSGAGCGNHWPLCNGQILPHHPRLATIIEFTHRSMTGVCTVLLGAVIAWTFFAHRKGERVRKAAALSAVLLLTEALLGALLVLGGFVDRNTSDTRVVVQCIHFTNTLLLLAALSLTWWWQRPQPRLNTPARTRALAWSALLFTMVTGATGSVAALADTLFPAPNLRSAFLADLSSASPLLVRMRWMHPTASIAACLCIFALAARLPFTRSRILISLVGLQLILGIADVLALAPITLQILHLFGADLLWIALVVACSEVLAGKPAVLQVHEPALPEHPALLTQ